ncbi:MAG: ATP-binding cassette domain-containing protein, partial [Muribaculaceae bacterium]|nr:ATP-binding cassette domain-containing protein [Muribaculaceae bacterium]
IVVRNVTFRYNRFSPLLTLDDVSAVFSEGKVTVIVGSSGSGKSTLMKLLLGYYRPEKGEILIGGMNLRDIPLREWRQRCGVVMQEGFIYNDTIERNVVMEEGEVDTALFSESLKVANLQNEVNALPLKGATVIGNSGRGLSLGQKQRILIARAVYKQPDVILFDEATNSLDSINEQKIVENLEKIYKGRTVIIIAHRLCTIRNADNIIVMDKGRIAATGTFDHLRSHSPIFYNLVKNQLEL